MCCILMLNEFQQHDASVTEERCNSYNCGTRQKRWVRNCAWPQSLLFHWTAPTQVSVHWSYIKLGSTHWHITTSKMTLIWHEHLTVCSFTSFTQTTLISSGFHLQTCNHYLTQTLKPHMCTLRVQNYPQKNTEFKVITATMF